MTLIILNKYKLYLINSNLIKIKWDNKLTSGQCARSSCHANQSATTKVSLWMNQSPRDPFKLSRQRDLINLAKPGSIKKKILTKKSKSGKKDF